MTGVFLAVVAIGLAIGWLLDRDAGGDEIAPEFSVETFDGRIISLSDHLADDGRPIVINLWASWCLPCLEEIPEISAYAVGDPGVRVIGIAVEDRLEDARQMAADLSPGYEVAFGDAEFRQDYPSIGLPATYFITADGVIAEVFTGVLDEKRLASKVAELFAPQAGSSKRPANALT